MDDRVTVLGRAASARPAPAIACADSPYRPRADGGARRVDWYEKEGCPALFFPEASDPDLFRPPELPKMHDVEFVGARYGVRERLVLALRAAGIRVSALWQRLGGGTTKRGGPAAVRPVPDRAGRGHDRPPRGLYAPAARDSMVRMSGSLYLTHANPTSIGCSRPPGDRDLPRRAGLVAVARQLLADDARREGIARAGRVRAAAEHTWERRSRLAVCRPGAPGADHKPAAQAPCARRG